MVSLIRSRYPNLFWYKVRDMVRFSADKVSGMNGQNFTQTYGYGRINVYKSFTMPLISNITQSPVPIYKGTSGYVNVNLVQGNISGNIYNWFSINQPSYVTISPNGSSCQITYLNVVESIPSDAPTWDFGCTVSNSTMPRLE